MLQEYPLGIPAGFTGLQTIEVCSNDMTELILGVIVLLTLSTIYQYNMGRVT